MKILIWLFCAFIYGLIVTTLSHVGILLGGLPTVILAGLLMSLAKHMCKKYDDHKAACEVYPCEQMPISNISEECVSDQVNSITEQIPVPISSPAAHPVGKQRYCKLCGNPVDTDTRKCTNCGKQYLRNPLKSIPRSTLITFSLLCICLILSLVTINRQTKKIISLEATVSQLNSTITDLNSTVTSRESAIAQYREQIEAKNKRTQKLVSENNELEEKSYYVDRNIAFIREDGTRVYHRYDCFMYKYSDSPFSVYSISSAMNKGYKPCSYCRGR